ncbi:M14 family zinc carboxypeptidase [Cruoricaptor ignavus]|uniref:M14 family zinc carboxypeptidase n=1 Tax=Cruoricaptor ignavus TaxID=1118202 RepID=UPI00370D4F14
MIFFKLYLKIVNSPAVKDFIYFCNGNFRERFVLPEMLSIYLEKNFKDKIFRLGNSFLGKPIYMLRLGKGRIKILAWSQMHGNESNATLAMLDFLESYNKNPAHFSRLFDKISLDFIFMLNPDGSAKWTRHNGQGIDLNRDFHSRESVELPLLLKSVEDKKYTYALNLHEQRSIFSTDGVHPATLSFLAPSENLEREITDTRRKCMAVIAEVYRNMENLLPNGIGRYTDEYYPNSVGDNFTAMGIPTVLFEGGHFPNDYLRKNSRKFYTIALYECLTAIAKLNGSEEGWEDYFKIPENKESHFDIIYRNVTLETDFPCKMDIAVHYREIIREGESEISFVPIVVRAGDCSDKKGWQEIDCTGKKFISESKFPKLDAEVNFKIE